MGFCQDSSKTQVKSTWRSFNGGLVAGMNCWASGFLSNSMRCCWLPKWAAVSTTRTIWLQTLQGYLGRQTLHVFFALVLTFGEMSSFRKKKKENDVSAKQKFFTVYVCFWTKTETKKAPLPRDWSLIRLTSELRRASWSVFALDCRFRRAMYILVDVWSVQKKHSKTKVHKLLRSWINTNGCCEVKKTMNPLPSDIFIPGVCCGAANPDAPGPSGIPRMGCLHGTTSTTKVCETSWNHICDTSWKINTKPIDWTDAAISIYCVDTFFGTQMAHKC